MVTEEVKEIEMINEVESVEQPTLTISKLVFNNDEEITIGEDDIIIFVGANNVGKSKTLKEIRDDLNESTNKKVIINKIEYKSMNFNKNSIRSFFEKNFINSKDNHGNYNIYTEFNSTFSYSEQNFASITEFSKLFYKCFYAFLSTEARLTITSPIISSQVSDISNLNIMKTLGEDENAITKLNDFLFGGFEKAIDVCNDNTNFNFCKSYKIGNKNEIDSTINSKTRSSNQQLKQLEELCVQGDGIRSAVGILASLIVNNQSIFLIDEPETFLHPPQARLLGNNIVDLSEKKQCFISTHNIDLIRGILEKNLTRVKIIKIDRNGNNNEFHVLDYNSVFNIANDRNLKYTNILNGLFYKKVVLCESESDCKFYSAILESLDSKLYQETLFCAVGGKDQFKVIIPLLNNLKIKNTVIADIDLINDITKLKQLLNSVEPDSYNKVFDYHDQFLKLFIDGNYSLIKKQNIIKEEINSYFTMDEYIPQEAVEKIKNSLKDINTLKLLKTGGSATIPAGDCKVNFNSLNCFLKDKNIFILDCGEIENFIKEISGHGNSWVEGVFTEFSDINNEVYDKAKAFISKVFNISK